LIINFSCSGAVHLAGGTATISGQCFLGPRIGKFIIYHDDTKCWEAEQIPGKKKGLRHVAPFNQEPVADLTKIMFH
jgi:ammonia channel protein AmtB